MARVVAIGAQEGASPNELDRLTEIAGVLDRKGFRADQECMSVVLAALRHLGKPYLLVQEFDESGIDCSTLTSQSHWEGAAIGIPFLAENQRVALSGSPVESLSAAMPGDVLIRYPNMAESIDGESNHVALLVGWDRNEDPWVLESALDIGVRLVPGLPFGARGGIRRFLLHPMDVFETPAAAAALRIAPLVPKLGRFGARQHDVQTDARYEHCGVDVYCGTEVEIVAPFPGRVSFEDLQYEDTELIRITATDGSAFVEFGHLDVANSCRSHGEIQRGHVVGVVRPPASTSRVEYPALRGDSSHVHFAYATHSSLAYGNIQADDWIYHNPLYACKIGQLGLPLHHQA